MTAEPETWHRLQSGPCPGAFNMAMDEALLEFVARLGRPVLRFYGWREPVATFGYFQRYREVARMTALRPLIRRPTGGGLVPHDADWTYSVVFPPGHAWYESRASESYQRLHEWLQAAFAAVGKPTALAPVRRKDALGRCFVGAEQHDLLWQDRKIAGAAQRRNRLGLLIQGSVQPPAGMVRTEWEEALCHVARQQWAVDWAELDCDSDLQERVEELAEQKYARREFNERR